MSWHYSLALEEAFSEACSSDGAPSAPWRSMPSAPDDSCSGKMKGTCHRSPFGMMFVPSTDAHGEALLTWFLEASPVRTSASQTPTATESTARKAASGESLRGSFARYDLGMSSWRTAQISLFGASDECLETWPRWGLMLDGACYPQQILEHGTCDKGSGLLPTLTATEYGSNRGGAAGRVGPVRESLQTMARRGLLPTLQARDWKDGTNPSRHGRHSESLPVVLNNNPRLPTLRATDGERGGRGDLLAIIRGKPNKHCRMPTLTANDCKPAGRVEVTEYRQKDRRTTVQRLRAAVTEPEQLGGTLNPDWCEWFMGWPIGWTASEPLATDRFRQWLLGHGRR